MMTSSTTARTPVLALALLLAACGSDPSNDTAPAEPLDLVATAAPFDLGEIEAEYYQAIAYGPHEENLFDIYLPSSDTRTPRRRLHWRLPEYRRRPGLRTSVSC